MQRLRAAGVRPTLKRILFVERTLANDPRHMLVTLSDMHTHAAPDESGAGSEDAVVQMPGMVRGVQRQLQEQQQLVLLLQEQMKQEKQQLLSLADRVGALGESGPGSDRAAVDTVRDLQRQVAQLQEQQQQQQQEHQFQPQELRLEMQQLMQQQRQEILQLTQQLQRLQQ